VTGTVFKRCSCPPVLDSSGRRRNCAKRHGSWFFVHDVHDPSGRRRQVRRGGYETAADARAALQISLTATGQGVRVQDQRDGEAEGGGRHLEQRNVRREVMADVVGGEPAQQLEHVVFAPGEHGENADLGLAVQDSGILTWWLCHGCNRLACASSLKRLPRADVQRPASRTRACSGRHVSLKARAAPIGESRSELKMERGHP
jgi:hypothetical protein